MNIDLKQFVNINIVDKVPSAINSTRDTVILYTAYGNNGTSRVISNITEANTYYSADETTLKYLQTYFGNGGVKVLVIEGVPYASLTEEMIEALDNKYICIAYASSDVNPSNAYNKLKSIAISRESNPSVYGINEKLILTSTNDFSDSTPVKNFVVKYSNYIGSEMTIAAYLSQINVYGIDTVYDYAFTKENFTDENISNGDFTTLMNNNFNIDVNLANAIRNCGGNTKDGSDLVNSYVRIILHQTLTHRLIDLLSQKIKGNIGISKIYSSIVEELEYYLNCGYLTTDKFWKDETLTITRNGVTYTIIEKGTPLVNGYYVSILPITALTAEEQAQHKAPPIYVIIADQYGIRQITINGEII